MSTCMTLTAMYLFVEESFGETGRDRQTESLMVKCYKGNGVEGVLTYFHRRNSNPCAYQSEFVYLDLKPIPVTLRVILFLSLLASLL